MTVIHDLFKHLPHGSLMIRAMTMPFTRMMFRRIDEHRCFLLIPCFVFELKSHQEQTYVDDHYPPTTFLMRQAAFRDSSKLFDSKAKLIEPTGIFFQILQNIKNR